MSAPARPDPYAASGVWRWIESAAAWLLAILWVLPLVFALWAAFHPPEFTTRFSLLAPLTLDNFARAKLIVRTTLLHARETAAIVPGAPPVELELTTGV